MLTVAAAGIVIKKMVSAAAVAAGLVPLAMGSQTVGSLIRPGAFCGVCAFKPTQARVPTTGVVPLAPSVDHVGLLAPDVASVEAGCRAMIDDWKNTTPDRLPILGIPHEDKVRGGSVGAITEWKGG